MDGLFFIGDEYVGSYVLQTSEGLIMIDCLWNSTYHFELIKKGFEDLELELEDLKYIIVTHGHTPAGVSIILPVLDEGKQRKAGLFGGTSVTPFMSLEECQDFLDFANRWRDLCDEENVDILLCVHPFEINAKEKIQLIRHVDNYGIANPFALGREGCRMFDELLIHRGTVGLEKAKKDSRKENLYV